MCACVRLQRKILRKQLTLEGERVGDGSCRDTILVLDLEVYVSCSHNTRNVILASGDSSARVGLSCVVDDASNREHSISSDNEHIEA